MQVIGGSQGIPWVPRLSHVIETWADTVARQLNANLAGRWYVWYVPRVGRGQSWHARRAGEDIASIDAETPEELVAKIAAQEAKSQA